MASDASVRLSVSGIAQFKSQMTSAKSSVKALDAELKLNAAEYKASGDAETYMANRARILSEQIKSQEDVVAACEKALSTMASQGVDKASSSYTQMQAALAKAKTDLVQMQTAAKGAGDELGEVSQKGDETAKSLQSIDKNVKWQNITSALDRIEKTMVSIATKAAEIGKDIWGWGRDAASWADDLATTAQMYGMDTETLQRYQYASKLIDTDIDTMIKASDKLSKGVKTTEEGIALITAGTSQFGIALKDTEGNARDQMDVLWDFIDVLGKVENETDRNNIAQEYFGKSYRELIPLIEAGRDAWDAAAESADVVTGENVNKLTALSNKMDELDQKWQTTKYTLMAQLAPGLERVGDALMRMMDYIDKWAASEKGQEVLERIGDAVARLFENFADGGFETLFDGAVSALDKISEVLGSITGDNIMDGLKTIGGIIAGWKLSGALLNGLNLIHNLRGGGSTPTTTPTPTTLPPTEAGTGLFMGSVLPMLATAAVAAAGAQGAYYVYEANKNFERGYNDTGYGSGTGQYDAEGTWKGTAAKYGKEVRYGADLANAGINSAQAFLYWDQENGTGTFGNFNENVNDAYVKLGEALAKGLISESDYYGAESKLNRAQELYSAFVWGSNKYGVYGWQDYSHKLNALTGGSAESGVEEYSEFVTIIDGILAEVGNLTTGLENLGDESESAGEELAGAFGEGALANVAAAYGAGAALAAAFASGASAASGGGSSTYNSSYVNSVNVYGASSPAEIAAAYGSYVKQQNAGYGG